MNRDIKRTLFALLLGVPVLLTGCARFTNPAVAEGGAAFDPALEGRWVLKNDTPSDGAEIQIRRKGSEGEITARSEEDGKIKVETARLITARLGRLNVMSLRSIGESERYWSNFRYDLDGDRLIITPGADDYWKKAVEDGRLEGTVEKGQLSVAITITATEAQLRAVLLGYGTVIFADDPSPEIVFERAR